MSDGKNYVLKLNLEGGQFVELDLSEERFKKLAQFCQTHFPDKDWKTKRVPSIEV